MAAQPADLVLTGARIHTLDPARPEARALAARAGRIVFVGDDPSALIGPATRVIDAQGATVLPGFIDSHVHMAGLGEALEMIDLRATSSVAEVGRKVREESARRKPDEWIQGRSWDQTLWGGRFPTASELNVRNPVYLTRVDGHAAWVNETALTLAGITAATPDPPGGRILRNTAGEPTGILVDNAQNLVARLIPAPDQASTERQLARAARECARLGLTTVHDAGIGAQELEAYRALLRRGELPVRIYAMIGGPGDLWERYLKSGPEIGDRFTVRSIKLMADGALGSRGAALLEPYSDEPSNRGLLILSRSEIQQVAQQAAEHGFQVNTHAIGDRTNRTVLEAYGAVLQGRNDRRFRIEHAQVIAPEDFQLFVRYSVIASMQATHATSDMRWAEARLGPERVRGAYAWQRFLSIGVPVPDGSDFPVEEPNPLLGFYAAITRQDRNGQPPGGWQPGQRMTRKQAIESWTRAGAYAAFEEKQKGMLASGMLADFIVLSKDILTVPAPEILGTHVRMTVLGGQVVYQEKP